MRVYRKAKTKTINTIQIFTPKITADNIWNIFFWTFSIYTHTHSY